ncbi:MAG: ATP-binding protein [Mangrovibacterium sp.]
MNRVKIAIFIILFLICETSCFADKLFFEPVTNTNTTPSSAIIGISKDSIGYIWMGSEDGLYRYNGFDFEHINLYTKKDTLAQIGRIRNVFTDNNKQLWIYTFFNKILKLDYNTDKLYEIKENDVPSDVLNNFAANENRIAKAKTIEGISYFIQDNKLCARAVTTGELITYRTTPDTFGGMTDDYITSFYVDDANTLWLGTREGIVYKANTSEQSFSYHNNFSWTNNRLIKAPVRTICMFKNELWVASNNYGISIYKDGDRLSEHPYYNFSSRQNQVRSMLEINDKLWIGGTKGLEIYTPTRQKLTSILNNKSYPSQWSKKSSSVYAIAQYKQWVITSMYNTIALIDSKLNVVKHLDLGDIIGEHSITDIEIDNKDKIWLCTEGNGIILISLDEKLDLTVIQHFKNGHTLSNIIYDFHTLNDNKLLIGNSDGLFLLQIQAQDSLVVIKQLIDKPTFSILEDNNKNIWSTHKIGLTKFDQDTEETCSFIPQFTKENWTFSKKSSFFDLESNTMYLGSNKGYISFDPNRISTNKAVPKLITKTLTISGNQVGINQEINGQKVLSRPLRETEKIELNYKNNTFSILAEPIYYHHAEKMCYYFKMEGSSKEAWTSSKNAQISYNKLKAGSYTFKVKALTDDGLWSNTCTIDIDIQKAWYWSTYMIILYIITTIAAIIFLIREANARQKLRNQVLLEKLHAEQVEVLNKERVDFFTNISHELRTPLSLIKDPLRQLISSDADTKHSYYLKLIDNNVEQLSKYINQIMDFRKAEAKKIEVNTQEADVIQLLRESIEMFQIIIKQRDMRLKIGTDREQLNAMVDSEKIRSIVQNILSNATKYTPDGGEIKLVETFANETLTIQVIDNGVGISNQDIKQIFEPFNNLGPQPFYGASSGMGLALTKKQVELLGGEIKLTSIPNSGTTVTITLPISEITDRNKIPDKETVKLSSEKDLLLIVEDSPEIKEYLYNELKENYEVMTQTNGLDGLNCAIETTPDIIVTDIMMPKMDGVEMTARLKEDERTSHIPIVILTAKTSDQSRMDGLISGASAYHVKPFNMEILKFQLNNILHKRKRFHQLILNKSISVQEAINKDGSQDLTNEYFLKIIELIEKNIANPDYRLESLAKELEISSRQLSRKLNTIAGITPAALITKIKMEKATSLLKDTNMNIAEVAYSVGYNEPSNFSRTFTKFFGISPSKYKIS